MLKELEKNGRSTREWIPKPHSTLSTLVAIQSLENGQGSSRCNWTPQGWIIIAKRRKNFHHEIEGEEPKTGKMKKGFKIITKTSNLRRHLKVGHVEKQANTKHLHDINARNLLKRSSTWIPHPHEAGKREGLCIVAQVVNFAMNTNHLY